MSTDIKRGENHLILPIKPVNLLESLWVNIKPNLPKAIAKPSLFELGQPLISNVTSSKIIVEPSLSSLPLVSPIIGMDARLELIKPIQETQELTASTKTINDILREKVRQNYVSKTTASAAESSNIVALSTVILAAEGDTIDLGSESNTYIDTDEGHTINGEGGADKIFGKGGDDTLMGGEGNDKLYGGVGADKMFGGIGDDLFLVDDSDVEIDGGDGFDKVYVSARDGGVNLNLTDSDIEWAAGHNENDVFNASEKTESVTLFGNKGNDLLVGGDAGDLIKGGPGNDTIDGGAGDDVIYGGTGADEISGGAGNDTIYIDADDTVIDGGAGFDKVKVVGSAGVNLNLTDNHIEWAAGHNGNDVFNAFDNQNDVSLFGNSGHDELVGGDGNDYIRGGAGNDRIEASFGSDTIYGGRGHDLINGGNGGDTIWGGAGNDNFLYSFSTHSNATNMDIIMDFEQGKDKLLMFHNVWNLSELTISIVGGNTLIADNYSDFALTLKGEYTLTEDDFLFSEPDTELNDDLDVIGDLVQITSTDTAVKWIWEPAIMAYSFDLLDWYGTYEQVFKDAGILTQSAEFTLFGPVAREAAESALAAWANVGDFDFEEYDPAIHPPGWEDIVFRGSEFAADLLGMTGVAWEDDGESAGEMLSADSIISDDLLHDIETVSGQDLRWADLFLQSVGFALGLAIPDADEPHYTRQDTVMALEPGPPNIVQLDPTPKDIAAIQHLYGANESYNTGNTTYYFDGTLINPDFAAIQSFTIWDAWGKDTLSAAKYITQLSDYGPFIDIREGIEFGSLIGNDLVSIAHGANIENAEGSDFDDIIHGNELENTLLGRAGNDEINGHEGADIIIAGHGNDIVNGGDGDDILYGDNGSDIINGGAGVDQLFGGDDADTFEFTGLTQSTFIQRDIILDFEQGLDKIRVESGVSLMFEILNGETLVTDRNSDFGFKLAGEFNLSNDDFEFM